MAFDTLLRLGLTEDFGADAIPKRYSFDKVIATPIRLNDVNYQTRPVWGEAIISPLFNTFTSQTLGRVLQGQALYRIHYDPVMLALRYNPAYRGTIAVQSGGYVGDDTFQWQPGAVAAQAYLEKAVLGSDPPSNLYISFESGSFRLSQSQGGIPMERNAAGDTSDRYAYQNTNDWAETITVQTAGDAFEFTLLTGPAVAPRNVIIPSSDAVWVRASGLASWDIARVRGFQYTVDSFNISSDGRYIQIDLMDGRSLNE